MTRLEKPKASVLLTSILPARFALPSAVACGDGRGGAVVADTGNHRIRQIRSDGVTVTVAGGLTHGLADGDGVAALPWRRGEAWRTSGEACVRACVRACGACVRRVRGVRAHHGAKETEAGGGVVCC